MALIATAFALAGWIEAETARVYQDAVHDGVALRIGEPPRMPAVPDLAFVHRAATDRDLRLHGVAGVGRELRVPPWPPFAITTVELWNDRTIVRFGGTEHHPAVQVLDGAGTAKPVTWSATGAGFGGAWETGPVDPAATRTVTVLAAGGAGEPGVEVDLAGALAPAAVAPPAGALPPEDVLDRIVERLFVELGGGAAGEREVNLVARQANRVAAELGCSDRGPAQVSAVLAALGWPAAGGQPAAGPDPAWLALATSSWEGARFRSARPLAVELPGLWLTALEDWSTVWVLRVRTPADRWPAFLESRWRAADGAGGVHAGRPGGPLDGTRVVLQPAPPRSPVALEVVLDGRRYEVAL